MSARVASGWLLLVLLAGCQKESEGYFSDRLEGSGIDFVHHACGSGRKYITEINCGSVTLLDYDGDGRLDVWFGQGAPLPGTDVTELDLRDRLYRNEGGLGFEDVTDATGVSEPGFSYAAAAPDYDGDGDQDLYVCNFDPNRFLRNDGGRFVDVTEESGAGCEEWTSAAAFVDFDRDGDLDVYLCNYVREGLSLQGCGPKERGPEWVSWCSPDEFPGAEDLLLRNDDGHYVDATRAAGMAGADSTGLSVVPSDYDDDGDVDLFVSNDGRPNYLWRNEGGLRFSEVAAIAGVAVSSGGVSQACMGADFADVDRDGDFDLMVANLAGETNTLYLYAGDGLFDDRSTLSGVGPPSLRYVGFGLELFDIDHDGDHDALVANGHILDNPELFSPAETFQQPPHLYLNDGQGRYRNHSELGGPWFEGRYVCRALAVGDLDEDGDLDAVVAKNDSHPALLENRVGQDRSWIRFRLQGQGSNTFAIGARLQVEAAGQTWIEELRGLSSYSAFHELVVHFGLGDVEQVERVTVRWPSGRVTEEGPRAVRQVHVLTEPGD